MKKGFMNFVATNLIPDFPGQTAIWYAREYLEVVNNGSDAKNQEQSLASTLNKQVQTGLERRVWRKKLNDGLYHYFPISMPPNSNSIEEVSSQFSIPAQELEDIDNLIAVGKFKSRSDAIKWLVLEGIKANRTYLDKVKNTKNEIERLKEKL